MKVKREKKKERRNVNRKVKRKEKYIISWVYFDWLEESISPNSKERKTLYIYIYIKRPWWQRAPRPMHGVLRTGTWGPCGLSPRGSCRTSTGLSTPGWRRCSLTRRSPGGRPAGCVPAVVSTVPRLKSLSLWGGPFTHSVEKTPRFFFPSRGTCLA